MLDRVFWWIIDRVIDVSYTSRLPAQHGDHQFRHDLWRAEADGEPLEPFDR